MRRDLKSILDNGDIIGVQGGMKRTDKGELSVAAKSIHVSVPWASPHSGANPHSAVRVLLGLAHGQRTAMNDA